MAQRGFEVVKNFKEQDIRLPQRKTALSAGYDIEAAADAILLPGKVTLVSTGLKAYMQEDEYLGIHIRSGLSIKNAVSLVNGQGIIDADYYDNQDNEGHIMIAFLNQGEKAVTLKKGERIAQGIFYKYHLADYDEACEKSLRTGGFGSTNSF